MCAYDTEVLNYFCDFCEYDDDCYGNLACQTDTGVCWDALVVVEEEISDEEIIAAAILTTEEADA